ncbi:SLAP domain-containing protein, partial [Lactobacillus sp.]|uniref:SLAP domain-containing protein n=1 Tax=Lactobacillus sp. TaxID=1591 RepID=UPI0025E41AE7
MNKNNSYKKVIVSLSGAALLTVGLGQMPNNVLNNTPVEVSAAKKTKVIGANSAIYRLKGNKMVKTGTVLKVGKKVSVSNKKTVKGKVYYKIGKNQYIKAVNVDGKNRNTAKKTVLYTRKGKVIKSSKIAKGQKVTIYGAAVTIKGKKYYSTKLGYIKASALAKKEPAIDNNDVEKPNENTTTPTDKPDSGNNTASTNNSNSGNNTASTNNSNSTSVPSTGGSSSTSPSVPTVDPALQPAKKQAIENITAKAKEAQDKIAGNKNLTDKQQSKAKEDIDKAVKDATDEKTGTVNAAKTTDDVKAAEKDATSAIDEAVKDATDEATKNLQDAKDAAVGKIKDAATAAKAKIAGNKNLTEDQQKTATDAIDEVVKDATDEKAGAVNAATTTDDVTTAEGKATDAIDNAVKDANALADKNLQDAKDAAVKDIKEAQDDAVNLVKSSPLTDAEKETAINQIEDIVKAALGEQKDGKSGSINDAKTLADVKKAVNEAKANCELVGNKLVSNDLAKQEGDFVTKAVAKLDDGDAKTAAPDKITKAVKAAKDAIASAKSQADLDKAEADFQNALNDAVPFAKQQEYAIDTINNAVKTAKDEINNDDWMSEDEKNATLSEIDTVVKLALGENQDGTSGDVHDATTTSDIFTAVNTVLAACRVKQTSDSLKKQQEAAIKEINQAAGDAIQAVNDTPASAENKQAAIDRINAIVKNALGEQKDGSTGDIHDAKSGSEVIVIKNKAINACKLEEDKLTSSELVSQVSDFASKSATKMDDGDAKTAAPDKITKAAKTA